MKREDTPINAVNEMSLHAADTEVADDSMSETENPVTASGDPVEEVSKSTSLDAGDVTASGDIVEEVSKSSSAGAGARARKRIRYQNGVLVME